MQQEPKLTPEELKKSYLDLVNDIKFDQLELLNNDVTFFEIIGASKTEIRHSNFLSWLLNPKGSHGLGEAFLKRFIREIVADNRAVGITEIEVEQFDFNDVRILREWNNIDLLIDFPDLVCVIENKILSKEHSNQLSRYKKIAEKEFPNKKQVFCYLTPNGNDSVDETDNYVSISYFHVVEILERIMKVKGDSVGARVQVYIHDYIKTLKKQVMQNDESVDLARKIYQNHKNLFDFIFENKPDLREHLMKPFYDAIKKEDWELLPDSKLYLRCCSKKLKLILPQLEIGEEWSGKEVLVFEFIFWSEKYVAFQVAIAPGKYNEKLKNVLLEMDDVKTPKGINWLAFFKIKMPVNVSLVPEMSEAERNKKVDTFMKRIKVIVERVEEQITNNIDRIINE